MLFDPYTSFVTSLVKAWQRDDKRVRVSLLTATALVGVAITIALLAKTGLVDSKNTEVVAGAIGAIAALLSVGVAAYQGLIVQQACEQKIETVEKRLREHPERWLAPVVWLNLQKMPAWVVRAFTRR